MHIADRISPPDGYRTRPFAGPADYPAMARILTDQHLRQGESERVSAEQIAINYRHLADCDPDLDIFVVETDEGEPVAYGRTMFDDLATGTRDCLVFAPVMAAHVSPALFHAITDACEAHMVKYVVDPEATRFRAWAQHPGPGAPPTGEAAWIEQREYVATEWGASLVRPDLDDIPERELPAGVEVRPVTDDQLRTIMDAYLEAFRGEWDFVEPNESHYAWVLDDPRRDHTLWQVAWAGDQVVGQVKPFIDHAENDERGYRRGYTEYIATHRDWRNRGLAGALLTRALAALRERGMTEAALGVDTNNPGGAFQLYTSLGFELRAYSAVYTKPVVLGRRRSGDDGEPPAVISVRTAQPADAAAIAELHSAAWQVGYRGVMPDEVLDDPAAHAQRLERWTRRLAHGPAEGAGGPDDRVVVALLDGEVAAFGHTGPEATPPADAATDPCSEVYACYAHPDTWGSGAADELMRVCLDDLRSRPGVDRAVLWVLRDNPRARRFYERHGWIASGRERMEDRSPSPSVPRLPQPVAHTQYQIDLVTAGI